MRANNSQTKEERDALDELARAARRVLELRKLREQHKQPEVQAMSRARIDEGGDDAR